MKEFSKVTLKFFRRQYENAVEILLDDPDEVHCIDPNKPLSEQPEARKSLVDYHRELLQIGREINTPLWTVVKRANLAKSNYIGFLTEAGLTAKEIGLKNEEVA